MRAAHALLCLSTLAGAIAATSCVRDGAPPIAPVEATSESIDGGAPAPLVVAAPPASPRQGDVCTGVLRPLPIKTGASCTLDEQISHGNGTISFPCSGDGAFEAVFGEHRFQGVVTGTSVLLALTTELDWQDGCHWHTKQTIRGEWRREGKVHSKLSWSYSEAPVRGTGCYGSCTASAQIEVVELSQ